MCEYALTAPTSDEMRAAASSISRSSDSAARSAPSQVKAAGVRYEVPPCPGRARVDAGGQLGSDQQVVEDGLQIHARATSPMASHTEREE